MALPTQLKPTDLKPAALTVRDLIGPDIALASGAADLVVTGITADSRAVCPGDIFAALPGSSTDGARFVPAAIAAGATAVLAPPASPVSVPAGVAFLHATEPRLALARIAARLYPAQPETMVAVTGTSGKSSVAEFTRQIFAGLGCNAASVGTIGVVRSDGTVYGSLTTPDPVTLHKTLATLAGDGVTHCAMEASSHGLDQRRLDGVRLRAAAWTNFGRDHLDYHPTVDDYFAAKLRLFTELLPHDGVAVVNIDDAHGGRVADATRATGRRVVTVGSPGADLVLQLTRATGFAQRVDVGWQGRSWSFDFPLLGRYQVENFLLAAGLALATGHAPDPIFANAWRTTGVPGRLEIVGEINGGMIVVDYAHKPDAMQAALDALRPFATGRLICVFGCGGNRDRGKRAIMGAISARTADVTIVTDDNPRNEEPAAIRAEIMAGAPGAIEIGDRAEAIRHAVAMIRPGDVVVVAGKGHETGQIIGATTIHFSDHEAVRAAVGQ